MTLLEETEAQPRPTSDPGARGSRPWLTAVVVVLCGLLILAHFGCHGDEDNELFSAVRWTLSER